MNSIQEYLKSGFSSESPLKSSLLQPTKSVKTFNLLSQVIDPIHPQWDILLPPKRRLEGHISKVLAFQWGGENHVTELVSCDDMGTIVHWNAAKGTKITLFELHVSCHSIAMEPYGGTCAAIGTANGKFHMCELNNIGKITKGINTKPMAAIPAHTGPIFAINFLGHEHIVTGSADKSVCVWSIHSLSVCISRHVKHEGEVYALAVFQDNPNIFLSGSTDGTCKIWDIRLPQPVQATFEGHTGAVNTVAFMPGKMSCFASGADDATVRLWDLRMDSEVAVFGDQRFPGDGVNSIAFSQSGRIILAGTDHNSVKSWDILCNAGPFEYFDYGFQGPIMATHLSSDGYSLGVLGKDGVLGIAY